MKEIVFVHGLHENANSWLTWITYFENAGYKCYAPSYPYHEGVPADLRKNPVEQLRNLGLSDVVAHYKRFISIQSLNPILIGHSMGGLVVQKLLQENIGRMAVCITSAAPKGIWSFKWSHIRSNLGTVNPLMGNSLFCGSKNWFHYAICNTLTREVSDEMYEKAVVPESRKIARTSRLKDGFIDFSKPHRPLLFIGAEQDHIIPISLNRKNFSAYKDTAGKKTFKEFKGRSHSICVQDNWQEVAAYTQNWIAENLTDTNV
jgi:pimeloyl-ACP methyl ester carboxylesterase